ncbi:Uma2 family endonuclease [Gloeobacter violaceus]|uniref:Glr2347 protein n=1 Tax=Gloeobacter violaceus (strain ATCC 29082 / PCC 7421) TaxID=251221 RepID=Q7NI37_GLOVI|nr:Uma2 family endonuclease [Gloeobacter violaceus]BAC90288.1 glr2347 [Gloeobacter violaceus PCC 7421]
MAQRTTDTMRWTAADLDLLPDDGSRYEIVAGELLVSRAPHWGHQKACVRLCAALDAWSTATELGEASIAPGVLFGESDNVIPDVVWVSRGRLEVILDAAGHLTAAPELVVEVLSPGADNERRDRDLKLRLYSARGVREYWLVDWRAQQVEVYRREQASLALAATLLAGDTLTSPLLPGFAYPVAGIFA